MCAVTHSYRSFELVCVQQIYQIYGSKWSLKLSSCGDAEVCVVLRALTERCLMN